MIVWYASMHRNSLILILISALMGACSFDAVTEGESCPPSGHAQSSAYLFSNGETAEWGEAKCPENAPNCIAFTSSDALFGHYYCASPCDGRQIRCDGICMDLESASNECKAANHKSEDESCTENACLDEYVLLCIAGQYQKHETPCPYGCTNGVCNPKPEDKPGPELPPEVPVCTSNDLRCEQGNLQVCLENAWTVKETCSYGCDATAKACITVSDPGTDNCTNGDKKCVGDFVTLCSGGEWHQATSVCPNGCENGECRTESSTPITGSGDSYCEGQILHYKDGDGNMMTTDCSNYAHLECQTLKDGTSDCVYNLAMIGASCSNENEIASAQCMEAAELGIENVDRPILYGIKCEFNSHNEFVGVVDVSISTCAVYQKQTVALVCEVQNDGSAVPAYTPCSTCNVSNVIAICDGTEMVGTQPEYDPDDLTSCDSINCMDASSNVSCSSACQSSGYYYCYIVISEETYFCSDTFMPATGQLE